MHDIFERIIARELPAEIVYEDEHAVAFLDIKPLAHGHTLVVPRKKFRNLLETPDEELAKLIAAVKKVALAVKEATGAQGINISFNNEAAAGQDVFHTHAHVIPRFEGDGLPPRPQGEYREGEMKQVADTIRKEIG